MTQIPSIGRIVHYVLTNGQHRPALVVNTASAKICNLTVFLDGANDLDSFVHPKLNLIPENASAKIDGSLGVASAHLDESGKKPGSWHWPEYVPATKDA